MFPLITTFVYRSTSLNFPLLLYLLFTHWFHVLYFYLSSFIFFIIYLISSSSYYYFSYFALFSRLLYGTLFFLFVFLLLQMLVRTSQVRLQCSLQHMYFLFYPIHYSNGLFLLVYELVAFITYTYSSLCADYISSISRQILSIFF
jgi:hypothetical protein